MDARYPSSIHQVSQMALDIVKSISLKKKKLIRKDNYVVFFLIYKKILRCPKNDCSSLVFLGILIEQQGFD